MDRSEVKTLGAICVSRGHLFCFFCACLGSNGGHLASRSFNLINQKVIHNLIEKLHFKITNLNEKQFALYETMGLELMSGRFSHLQAPVFDFLIFMRIFEKKLKKNAISK